MLRYFGVFILHQTPTWTPEFLMCILKIISYICDLLLLMTISHKAGHYCHFRVLCSVDRFIVIQAVKKKKVLEFTGRGTFDLKTCAKGGGQNCIRGEFVPAPDCISGGRRCFSCMWPWFIHSPEDFCSLESLHRIWLPRNLGADLVYTKPGM